MLFIMAIVSHKEFKAFFETFFIPVYTLMQCYTGECELSRDFTQEAFVRVFEHRGEFEDRRECQSFLVHRSSSYLSGSFVSIKR